MPRSRQQDILTLSLRQQPNEPVSDRLASCTGKERKEYRNEESNEKDESSDCSSYGVGISDV